MMLRALCILHPGFEEIEAITPIDLLTRAGVEVTLVGLDAPGLIEGKNGVRVQALLALEDVAQDNFDLCLLPGGPGILKIRQHPRLCEALRQHVNAGAWIGCICAAPLLLLDAGLCDGLKYTAHPSTLEALPNAQDAAVVVDGHIVTSRGAGTATEFALTLIERLMDRQTAKQIAESICYPHS